MLPKFQAALERLEKELSSLDQKAKAALTAASSVFDTPEMKEFGPHDLCSVVVSDGFSGRDHIWTYLKSDDGKWFKSLDQNMIEVSLETVLSDPAGLHMNSGHIFAIYVQRPLPGDAVVNSEDIRLRPPVEEALSQDDQLFAAEVLESTTLPTALDPDAESEVLMTTDSPRSDVAEAGGALDFERPLRLRGGASSFRNDAFDRMADDDDQSDDDPSDLVELGFLKKIKRRLDVKTMTGKVGGRPLWLDPSHPLDTQSLTCGSCARPLTFLLQMNAPEESNPNAYYRNFYVFICRKMSCIRSDCRGALKAFRIQLPEKNMPDGIEMRRCSDELLLGIPFREWELRCEEEPEEVEIPDSSFVSPSHLDRPPRCQDPDAKEKDTKAPVDEAFLKFQSRIARAPTQILRYLRVSAPPVAPLWASDSFDNLSISPCPVCSTRKTAEFQILSTILSSLGDLNESSEDGLDFGTIVVYSCPNSCDARSDDSYPGSASSPSDTSAQQLVLPTISTDYHPSWTREDCWIQMFSNDGVEFKKPCR